MGDDRGVETQADARHIPTTARLTIVGRRQLSMDELANLRDARPRLEKEMRLPPDAMDGKLWFFSIDGTLGANHVRGALFAGNCIAVQSSNFAAALRLARDGLEHSIRLAREYFNELTRSIVTVSPVDRGTLEATVGGRKARVGSDQAPLATDEKLKRMIEARLSGKPWRG